MMLYLHFNNKQYGPYTEDQVRGMIAAGKVPNSTLVYDQSNLNQWEPLSKYPHLLRPPKKKVRDLAADPTLASIPIEASDMERKIWNSHPSIFSDLGTYIKYFLLLGIAIAPYPAGRIYLTEYQTYVEYLSAALSVIVIIKLLWNLAVLKSTSFVLTTNRFVYSVGLFSRRTESLELYRVKDITLRMPFFLRLFGYGFVDLITSDKTDSNMPSIGAIKKPGDLYENIRKYTERQRQRRGVREVDIAP
jgi:hypothetical protein